MSSCIQSVFVWLMFILASTSGTSLDPFQIEALMNKLGDISLTNDHNILTRKEPAVQRFKRQLVYPVDTVLQLTFAVVSPILLKEYNMFVNNGFQYNFALPSRISQLPATFIFGPPVINGRSRTKRDHNSWTGKPSQSDSPADNQVDKYNDITSEELYLYIESYLTSQGYNGSGCVLHAICELAAVPLHQDDDLMHEILHFTMTPSEHGVQIHRSKDECRKKTDNGMDPEDMYCLLPNPTPLEAYLEAEARGRNEEDCDVFYDECKNSPLEKMTQIRYYDDENMLDS